MPCCELPLGTRGRSTGFLAVTALGERAPLDFGLRRLSAADVDALLGMQPVRRALALTQVGQHVRAGAELRRFAHRLSPRLALVVLALASESGLPDLSYRAAESLLQRTGCYRGRGALPVAGVGSPTAATCSTERSCSP